MNLTLENLYYYPLKLYVIITCYLYFRKLRVNGLKNVAKKSSIIYAINHQNALLDPLVIHSSSWKNPYFLTRGDIFKNKFVDKFLRGIKMLPIYRIRDGFDSIKMNEPIFEATKEILLRGGVVGIFPEGSHNLQYRIRNLKKGIARMAFMAEEAADFNLDLKIVPVGLYYESHLSTKGRTLVNYGEPIRVADFKEAYVENPNKGITDLISSIQNRMKSLTLHFDNKNDYEQNLKLFKEKRVYKKNLVDQLEADQALVDHIEKGIPFNIKADKRNIVLSALGNTWLMLWRFVSFIPKSIVDFIIKKNVKDPHFFATMRYGYSVVIYPIVLLILYFLIRYLVF